MRILYISLFPENNNCHEIQNLKYFIDSSIDYGIDNIFCYRLFSAHNSMVEQLRKVFNCNENNLENLFDFNNIIQIKKLDTNFSNNIDELRAHEISFCKQKIHTFITLENVYNNFDYIFYNDADIRIDANDIVELCKVLESKNKDEQHYFVNIPYVLKITKQVVEDSLGSYILPKSIVKQSEYILDKIYETYQKDDLIYRKGAPDWIIRKQLLLHEYNEIRGDSCHTQHYLSNENYYEYDSRRISFF